MKKRLCVTGFNALFALLFSKTKPTLYYRDALVVVV